MKKKIKWIFFDVGGVLLTDTKTEGLRKKYLLKVLKTWDSNITLAHIEKAIPKARGMIGKQNDNILGQFIKNKTALAAASEQMQIYWKEKVRYTENSSVNREAKDVLKVLSKNYKLGVLANQPVSAKDKLQKAGIDKYFEHFTVSAEHGLEKPDPKFFRAIFKASGAKPKESTMIDDNIERGLLPAKKFGMTTVWLKNQNRKSRKDIPADKIDFTTTSLKDLLKLF
jgi:HAD superfamily hydrolase (TIGR01509 family)